MGAIYISPEAIPIPPDVFEVFRKKGFSEPRVHKVCGFNVALYTKQWFNAVNYLEEGENELFATGTCFYKNQRHEEGLRSLLNDYVAGTLNVDHLYGSYLLLLKHGEELKFLTDRAGVQNVFFNAQSGIISSSFLAAIAGVSAQTGRLKLNKAGLTETLITGSLIGPDTLVEGIMRYEGALDNSLPGIPKVRFPATESMPDHPVEADLKTMAEQQLDVLGNYFNSLYNAVKESGLVLGLTGGFDSRLLFLAIHKSGIRPAPYTNSNTPNSQQVQIARKLATAKGYELNTPEYTGAEQDLSDNFYLNDGLIRIYQIWLEEVKSRAHLKKIYQGQLIGTSGVGGEQYRNSDLLIAGSYNFESWVLGELIAKYSGNVFYSKAQRKETIKRVTQKISALLHISANKPITAFDIKRFNNEIYNAANRVSRNNIENQLAFFLSPFTEYSVAWPAYKAFAYLGGSHVFEKEMICRVAPEVENIETDYGYKIAGTVPLKYRLLPIAKALFGLKLYNRFYFFKKKKQLSPVFSSIKNSGDYLALVNKLALPIHVDQLKNNPLLAPLLIETGIFLKEMEAYLAYD